MTDADARLKALLQADAPPAMDAYFRLAVFERMEERAAVLKLVLVVGVGVAATVATAMLSPALTRYFAPGAMLIAGSVFAGAATVWGVAQMRRPI